MKGQHKEWEEMLDIQLTRGLYPEHMKSSYNSVIKKKKNLKYGKNI